MECFVFENQITMDAFKYLQRDCREELHAMMAETLELAQERFDAAAGDDPDERFDFDCIAIQILVNKLHEFLAETNLMDCHGMHEGQSYYADLLIRVLVCEVIWRNLAEAIYRGVVPAETVTSNRREYL